jgi:O-antigen ligase
VAAAFQYFKASDYFLNHRSDRLTSFFSSANGFSAWLILFIPVFGGLLWTKRKDVFGRRVRVPLAALVFVLFACLLLTYSRGAWVGLAAGVFFIALYFILQSSPRHRAVLSGVFGCLILISFILPQAMKEKIASVSDIHFRCGLSIEQRVAEKKSIKARGNLWMEAFSIIKERPLFGCGLNTYARVAPKYKRTPKGGIYPHNSFLQKTAETGLLGLAAFLGVLFLFFRTGLRHLRQKKSPMVLGFLAGIVSFLVHAVFDNHLYALQLVVLFWFMLGLTVAVIHMETKNELTGSPQTPKGRVGI